MKLSPTAFFKAVLCVFQHMNLKHSNSSPKSDDKKNIIPLKAVMGGRLTQTMHRRPGEAVSRNQSCFSDGRFQY